MKQITITLEDDGRIIVESPEMDEPYMCESVDECKEFVGRMLDEEAGEEQMSEGNGRDPAIVVPDERLAAGLFRCLDHLASIVQVVGQGLFARDVLARL